MEEISYLKLVWNDASKSMPDSKYLVFLLNAQQEIRLGRKNGVHPKFEYYTGSSAHDFWEEDKATTHWAYVPLTEQ